MNVDNEDPFESDSENGSETGDNDSDVEAPLGELASEEVSTSSTTLVLDEALELHSAARLSVHLPIAVRQPSSAGRVEYGAPTSRRFNAPSIFSHPGVRTPSAVLDSQRLLLHDEGSTSTSDPNEMNPNLEPILESRRASATAQHEEDEVADPDSCYYTVWLVSAA
ncbi:hypothetical protein GYMLUDRAFT_247410 [Collybiopsis luxurians FD-317 M1]|uniref:Uncharacterized protein n=1 Tax=Collybiopsis luxurians FD-317 M1 TaxID=944289 RepID=A0A0D0CFI4_9AGAR|nr:hypothetical protein GYMLUDRAFT_247410 [Collybiopsis luxurians FD-317 M1]